jgi:hypothetical protein
MVTPNPVTLSETHNYTMPILSELNFMHRVSHTIKIQIKSPNHTRHIVTPQPLDQGGTSVLSAIPWINDSTTEKNEIFIA